MQKDGNLVYILTTETKEYMANVVLNYNTGEIIGKRLNGQPVSDFDPSMLKARQLLEYASCGPELVRLTYWDIKEKVQNA
jgi:hypothetical protein